MALLSFPLAPRYLFVLKTNSECSEMLLEFFERIGSLVPEYWIPVNTPLRHAEPNKCNLYSLGISPINAEIVEKSLIEYPLPDKKKELISGLKFGLKLQYSGTKLLIRSKNSKSIIEAHED
jgi:hypothetical protein